MSKFINTELGSESELESDTEESKSELKSDSKQLQFFLIVMLCFKQCIDYCFLDGCFLDSCCAPLVSLT